MATITFKCSQCGQNLTIDNSAAGMQIQCPKCSNSLVVPSANAIPTQIVAPAAAGRRTSTALAQSPQPSAPETPLPRAPLTTQDMLLRLFFIAALVAFFMPVVSVGSVATSRDSVFDVVLQLTNSTPSSSFRTFKEVLFNGTELAKHGETTSVKVMLGVVLLWITTLGLVVSYGLAIACATFHFGSKPTPSALPLVTYVCAMQFVILTFIGNSFIRSGLMTEPAATGSDFMGMRALAAQMTGRQIGVAPDWGAWLLAAVCLLALVGPSVLARIGFKNS